MPFEHTHLLSLLSPTTETPPGRPQVVRALGIDLGTTNSAVAEVVWNNGEKGLPEARCLDIEQETDTGLYTHTLVPSVVALHQGRAWVGEGAKRLRAKASFRRNKDIFYECKNDMGLRRTYHLAPQGLRSAAEVSAKILDFLVAKAGEGRKLPPSRVVITVPASFQMPQRNDTVRAAQMAGIEVKPEDLLDEPVAAFIDYLVSHHNRVPLPADHQQNLLVFDFGGGTCDVAIFRLFAQGTEGLGMAPLSVSRYHRLGGGDIDGAMVHEVLIPQLAAKERIEERELGYEIKKHHLEPALLSVAEKLKVGLCREISRLEQFGRYAGADALGIAPSRREGKTLTDLTKLAGKRSISGHGLNLRIFPKGNRFVGAAKITHQASIASHCTITP